MFRIVSVLHEVQQYALPILFVLEVTAPSVELQAGTQVAVHQLQRIVDRCDDMVYPAVRVYPGVRLEYLFESGIGVGTGTMAGFLQSDRHMVIERN